MKTRGLADTATQPASQKKLGRRLADLQGGARGENVPVPRKYTGPRGLNQRPDELARKDWGGTPKGYSGEGSSQSLAKSLPSRRLSNRQATAFRRDETPKKKRDWACPSRWTPWNGWPSPGSCIGSLISRPKPDHFREDRKMPPKACIIGNKDCSGHAVRARLAVSPHPLELGQIQAGPRRGLPDAHLDGPSEASFQGGTRLRRGGLPGSLDLLRPHRGPR